MTQLVAQSTKIKTLSDLLASGPVQRQLARALPAHISADKLARIALTQVQRIPKLLDCDQRSFFGALMEAAQLGLQPGILGECWIIPYKGKAQLVPGYRGLAQLAWRSGLVASLGAHAVYEGDDFAFDFGADTLRHVPYGETDPAKLTHAWAFFRTKDLGRVFDVMNRREIERVRERSPSGNDGPWVTDYPEMAKKTVFKRIMKLAPLSVDIQRALELEESMDRGDDQGLAFELPQEPEREVNPPPAEAASPPAASGAEVA